MSSSDRGTATSVRTDVAAWVAVLLATFLALGCDAAQNGRPTADGAQLRGRILYAVSTSDPFATRGRLFSLNLEDGERQPLADDVGQVMTSDGRRVVVVKYGPETVGRYGPYVPTLLLIDLATGATTAIGTGTGPRLGPEGRLAYCKTDGQSDPRVVVVRLERPDEITEVAGPYVNCPIMAWSRDGRLAFLAPVEEGKARWDPDVSLHLYEPDGAGHDELTFPRHFQGYGHLSWSADGTRIAFCPALVLSWPTSGHGTSTQSASRTVGQPIRRQTPLSLRLWCRQNRRNSTSTKTKRLSRASRLRRFEPGSSSRGRQTGSG